MRCEIHHGGNSLNNVANLHVTMAMPNCEFFEFFPCTGANMYGLVEDIALDDGWATRRPSPGSATRSTGTACGASTPPRWHNRGATVRARPVANRPLRSSYRGLVPDRGGIHHEAAICKRL